MNGKIATTAFKCCTILGLALSSTAVFADDVPSLSDLSPEMVRYQFNSPHLAGIETRRLQNIRIRGWQVTANAYIGQTKVAHRSGFGVVFRNGNTVYQLNNRGIQVTRYF